ncbi:hypothetical protein [Myceligenerans crystallogenes]|uniref:Mce-associated membrane protein n=1 Tax=Myceligenerans crystallogenes TaxID=316335 RepID=A0ABP4ZXA2_9MICO
MHVRKRTIAAALSATLAVAAAVGLTACTSGAGEPAQTLEELQASESAAASAPAEVAPSPEADEKKQAVEAAKLAFDAFLKLDDDARQNIDSFDEKRYEEVAVDMALVDARGLFRTSYTKGYRSVGDSSWELLKTPKVDLKNKPKSEPPVRPTVELTVCIDTSAVDVVDRDGVSVVPEGGQSRYLSFVSVVDVDHPNDEWRVSDVGYTEDVKSC